MNRHNLAQGTLLMCAVVLIWGAFLPVSKIALAAIDPYWLTLLRYGVAALCFLVTLALLEGRSALAFEGQGGAAGFAKGAASVRLEDAAPRAAVQYLEPYAGHLRCFQAGRRRGQSARASMRYITCLMGASPAILFLSPPSAFLSTTLRKAAAASFEPLGER